jgi:hypothetical protein
MFQQKRRNFNVTFSPNWNNFKTTNKNVFYFQTILEQFFQELFDPRIATSEILLDKSRSTESDVRIRRSRHKSHSRTKKTVQLFRIGFWKW